MLRLLSRFLGLLLLAGGFIALIVDGTRSIAGGELTITTLRRGAVELFPSVYESLQTSVVQKSALLWDPIITTLMILPVSIAFGGLAFLLFGYATKTPSAEANSRELLSRRLRGANAGTHRDHAAVGGGGQATDGGESTTRVRGTDQADGRDLIEVTRRGVVVQQVLQ